MTTATFPLRVSLPQTRLLLFALSVTGLIWGVGAFLIWTGPGFDTYAYWLSTQVPDPYTIPAGFGAFQYPPPSRLLFAPLGLLGWPAVYWAWLASSLALLAWMCQRWTLAVLAFLPLIIELYEGNVHVLLAAAIVASFRFPALWSVVLLTKVTPGIGLLWYVVRREWRNLGIALGVTAGIVLLSLVVYGLNGWTDWARHVLSDPVEYRPINLIPVPLLVRLPIAALVVVWGARTDRRWAVPVAAMLALPLLWIYSLAMLVAIVPLAHRQDGLLDIAVRRGRGRLVAVHE